MLTGANYPIAGLWLGVALLQLLGLIAAILNRPKGPPKRKPPQALLDELAERETRDYLHGQERR